MSSKGFANVAVLIFVVLALLGVGYVIVTRGPQAPPAEPPSVAVTPPEPPSVVPTPSVTPPSSVDTSNWKTYRGPPYELRYPSYLSPPASIGERPGSLFFVADGKYPPTGERLVLNLEQLDEFPSLEDYFDGLPKRPSTVTEGDPPVTVTYPGYTKIKSTEVGGYPAIEYLASPQDYGSGSVDTIGVFFNGDRRWYRGGHRISLQFPTVIRERENIQALFEEIISTVRFASN